MICFGEHLRLRGLARWKLSPHQLTECEKNSGPFHALQLSVAEMYAIQVLINEADITGWNVLRSLVRLISKRLDLVAGSERKQEWGVLSRTLQGKRLQYLWCTSCSIGSRICRMAICERVEIPAVLMVCELRLRRYFIDNRELLPLICAAEGRLIMTSNFFHPNSWSDALTTKTVKKIGAIWNYYRAQVYKYLTPGLYFNRT